MMNPFGVMVTLGSLANAGTRASLGVEPNYGTGTP